VFATQVRSTACCRPAVGNLPLLGKRVDGLGMVGDKLQSADTFPQKVVHRALKDTDYISHKGTKDTKEFTAV